MIALKHPETARMIDSRYRILDEIGRGAMGTVYRVQDRLTGQVAALKRVTAPTQRLVFGSMYGGNDLRVMLTQEFRLLAHLRHPNIISVLDYGFDDGQYSGYPDPIRPASSILQLHPASPADTRQPYFTMELLENSRDLLSAAHETDFNGRLDLMSQLLQALVYLHRHHILHRDLKPGNVLVVGEKQVRVVDFGLAIETRHAVGMIGSIAYMAPEVLKEQPATPASDLYAAGIMMYECCTGRHPFDTSSIQSLLYDTQHSSAPLEPLQNVLCDHPGLAPVILRMLEKDPLNRYQDASQVLDELSAAAGRPIQDESITIRESYLQGAEFVGREAEVQQLNDALKQMLAGGKTGSAWLIGGESGVGKSRLLDDLRVKALVEGALLVTGQGVRDSQPNRLWRMVLPRLLLSCELTSADLQLLNTIVPDLESIISVPKEPVNTEHDYQQRLTHAVAAVFKQQQRPVVMLLDDLHWAQDTLPVLRALCRLTHEIPLMIVGTYRSDEFPYFYGKLPDMQTMTLARFSRTEIQQLSIAMLGEAGKMPRLIDLLWHETEGNSFYIVEVLRVLAEEAGRLDNILQMALPERVFARQILEVARRRLALLPLDDHPMLRIAAMIGREIDLNLLQHIDDEFDESLWLMRCADAAVLEINQGKWRFAHEKIREGILFGLEENQLPRLHRIAAEAIEAVYPNNEEYARRLLELWRQAGDLTKEIFYSQIVVRQLLLISEFEEAQTMVTATLEKLEQIAEPARTAARITFTRYRGDTCEGLTDYDSAVIWYQQSLTLAEAAGNTADIAEARIGLGKVAMRRWRNDEAEVHYRATLALYQQMQDERGVAHSLHGIGTALLKNHSYDEASHFLEQSLAINQRVKDQFLLSNTLNNLGVIAAEQGRLNQTRDYYRQALAVRREIGDRRGVAATLNNLAVLSQIEGDLETAKLYNRESLSIKQSINDQDGASYSLHNLGTIAETEQDYPKALDYYQQALAIAQERGHFAAIVHSLSDIAMIHSIQKNFSDADQAMAEALKVARESGQEADLVRVIWGAASVAFHRGDLERAGNWLGFVMEHPRRDFEMADKVPALIARLKEATGIEAAEAHLQRGQTQTMEVVLAQIEGIPGQPSGSETPTMPGT